MNDEITKLKAMWEQLFPDVLAPDYEQWLLWTARHKVRTVSIGLVEAAIKRRKLYRPDDL